MKQFTLTSTNPALSRRTCLSDTESNDLYELLCLAREFADEETGECEYLYCFINNDSENKPQVMLSRSILTTPMTWEALFDSDGLLFLCNMLECTADEIEFPRRDEE